ncbi:MAG: hypothetical protein KF901_32845, partial [Myxococcales bacterium]|nr:hypothetical protein [Myxococcales bacterium]
SDSDSDSDSDSETDSETDTNSDTDTDSETDSETDSDSDPDSSRSVDAPAPADVADSLVGGASTGVFLHAVLEHLDFAGVRRPLEEWRARPEVEGLFRTHARRAGVDEAAVPLAQELIWRALRAPLRFGDARLDEGFAALVGRVAREMSFFFPVPERWHPRLPDPSSDSRDAHDEGPRVERPFTIGRGVIRGVIDLVFEHAGPDGTSRTYFLDWKSDRVATEEGWEALEEKVRTRYALQARLYTLGVVRLLGVHDEADYEARFGGLLYCFLRAMGRGEDARGVVFERPRFDEVVAWERELRESDAPWGYPLLPFERQGGEA